MNGAWPGDRPGDPCPMPYPAPPPPCPRDKPITVRVKRCCGDRLVRERCRCAALRRQIRRAPVLYVTARRAAA